MSRKATEKQAAKESKSQGARYVVYVPDQGYDVFDAEQVKTYGSLVFVEATYIGGVKVASIESTAGEKQGEVQ